jgi:hypothetical protein
VLAHWEVLVVLNGAVIQVKLAKVVAAGNPNAICCVCVMVVHLTVATKLQVHHWHFLLAY